MTKGKVEKICEALLVPLGFLCTQTGWKRSMESYTIVVYNEKMTLVLKAENLDVPQQVVKHIAGADAPVSLRRKLGRLEKMALRASRAQKRAKRQAILAQPIAPRQKAVEEAFSGGYAALRNFNPLCYCSRCRQLKRADMMEDENTCIACVPEK